jgi:hypothetical protein
MEWDQPHDERRQKELTMKSMKKNAGLKVKTAVKSGGGCLNHTRMVLR